LLRLNWRFGRDVLDDEWHTVRKNEQRASELAILKDLREAVERTQEDLTARLGVGQDTVSRIERRSDILLSSDQIQLASHGLDVTAQRRLPRFSSWPRTD
jgi:DNA-binding XRE family transcriptional regulator